MNASLATQLFSASVGRMIRMAVKDEEVVLPKIINKNVFNHLADLCEYWDQVVDMCNDRWRERIRR